MCVIKLGLSGSDDGLPPVQHQAISRTNDEVLLIEPLRANFC